MIERRRRTKWKSKVDTIKNDGTSKTAQLMDILQITGTNANKAVAKLCVV